KSPAELSWARDLVRTMARLNLRRGAAEEAARFLDLLRKEDVREGWDEVLEPLFESDADVAATWWRYLREKQSAVEAMHAVLRLMDGPAPDELDKWAAGLATVDPRRDELPSALESRSFTWPAFAAASALLRTGREAKAREYFTRAMDQRPDAS